MLARGGHGQVDLEVHAVGRRDVNDLHLGMVDHGLPVWGRRPKAEPRLRRLRPGLDGVGADHEPWPDIGLEEAIGNLVVGPAVRLAHPAHANDPDADCPYHRAVSHPGTAAPADTGPVDPRTRRVAGSRTTPAGGSATPSSIARTRCSTASLPISAFC